MFYCDPCGTARGWPTATWFRSRGPCECCGTAAVCNEVKSSLLPPPPLEFLTWRVRHPGIGVLTYPDETSARVAAGTAGVVYPPGESHRTEDTA